MKNALKKLLVSTLVVITVASSLNFMAMAADTALPGQDPEPSLQVAPTFSGITVKGDATITGIAVVAAGILKSLYMETLCLSRSGKTLSNCSNEAVNKGKFLGIDDNNNLSWLANGANNLWSKIGVTNNIYNTDLGNVGIGTTNAPSAKLDVNGSGKFSSDLAINGGLSSLIFDAGGSKIKVKGKEALGYNSGSDSFNWGLGLGLGGYNYFAKPIQIGADTEVIPPPSQAPALKVFGNSYLRGYVGIGRDLPQHALDVVGGINGDVLLVQEQGAVYYDSDAINPNKNFFIFGGLNGDEKRESNSMLNYFARPIRIGGYVFNDPNKIIEIPTAKLEVNNMEDGEGFKSAILVNGDVDIDTGDLSVNGANAQICFGINCSGNNKGKFLGVDNDGKLSWLANGANNLWSKIGVTNNIYNTDLGNVGIGTTNAPSAKLDVNGSGKFSSDLAINGGLSSLIFDAGGSKIKVKGKEALGYNSGSDSFNWGLGLGLGGYNYFQKSVKIGGTNDKTENAALEVGGGSNTWLRAKNSSGPYVDVGADTNSVFVYGKNEYPLRFATDNVERMRITSDGKVGIGTTTPTSQLEVKGESRFFNYNPSGRALITSGSSSFNGNVTVENGSMLSTDLLYANTQGGTIKTGNLLSGWLTAYHLGSIFDLKIGNSIDENGNVTYGTLDDIASYLQLDAITSTSSENGSHEKVDEDCNGDDDVGKTILKIDPRTHGLVNNPFLLICGKVHSNEYHLYKIETDGVYTP